MCFVSLRLSVTLSSSLLLNCRTRLSYLLESHSVDWVQHWLDWFEDYMISLMDLKMLLFHLWLASSLYWTSLDLEMLLPHSVPKFDNAIVDGQWRVEIYLDIYIYLVLFYDSVFDTIYMWLIMWYKISMSVNLYEIICVTSISLNIGASKIF